MKDSRNSPARDHHPAVASGGLHTVSVSLAELRQTIRELERELANRTLAKKSKDLNLQMEQLSPWALGLGPGQAGQRRGCLSPGAQNLGAGPSQEEKSWAAGSRGPSYSWAGFVRQAETDLQHLRQEFQGKKEIISEVQAAVSTVQASLAEQSLSVQNLRQGVGEALQEMEALQLTMQAEQTQDQALWPQDRHVSTPAPTPETVLLEMVGQGISALWEKRGGVGRMVRRAQWLGSRLLLLFGVSWTAFYILIVHPALLEGLVPPLLSKGTVWRVRGFFTPFLRLEVDDLLPF